MKIVCPQCGFTRDVPEDKLPGGHVVAKCPKCGCRFGLNNGGAQAPEQEEDIRVTASNAYKREAKRFADEQAAANAVVYSSAAFNPWDCAPMPDGWAAAFYQTVIRVMFQAQAFFANLFPRASVLRPLAFFLIICILQTLIERGWGEIFASFLAEEAANDPQLAKLTAILAPDTSIFLTLLLRGAAFVLQIYLFSLLMFLAYRIVARERATFALVFQILAYSAAPWILCIIPALGSLVGAVWGIGCMAVGCKAAMGLTWPQTIIGFLPPLFVMMPIFPHLAGIFA